MKTLLSLLLFLMIAPSSFSQEIRLSNMLFNEYENHLEESIDQRRFTHSDIEPLIQSLTNHELFEVKQLGESVEGRPIYLVQLGSGDIDVLLWSQMHGNESTATMALFDLFNFFQGSDDSFEYTRKRLLKKVSLYFIPMLNPDGAESFQRRNALGIDLNRDALRLTSPESQILKSVQDSLNPEFGFNLHDQSIYYSAGDTASAATLSFLAPAYDYEQSENEVRTRAMKLIAYLNPMLQQYIPGGVAKYSDAHEPRAFGDNIQKWGTSTILIESGGYPDDPEKQFIRKLNFVTLLTAIDAIAEERYTENTVEEYFDIPQNRRLLSDLVIRNAIMSRDGVQYKIDLEINQQRRQINDSLYYYSASISDIGDLSTQYGYEEIDAEGMEIIPGQVYSDTLQNMQQVQQLNFQRLINNGYTSVFVLEAPTTPFEEEIPLNIISRSGYQNEINLWHSPNFIIKEDDKVRYAIINGFVYDVEEGNLDAIKNTLVED